MIPRSIQLYESLDKKNWTKVKSLEGFQLKKEENLLKQAIFKDLNIESKFIKINAEILRNYLLGMKQQVQNVGYLLMK